MPTEQQATPEQLIEAEASAAEAMFVWVNAYRDFPTPENFDGLTQQMRAYQKAWMNGRKR